MKIRLITFHTPKNYGAVLQGYSLYSYLKSQEEDTLVIDYNTPSLRSKYPLLTKPLTIKQAVLWVLSIPYVTQNKNKFHKIEAFVNEHYGLTHRYESTKELYDDPPICDLVFTGSDQVFNPNRDKEERQAFYLDFVPEGTIKASYAGSFGVSAIPQEKQEEISGYLAGFDHIAVRESQGVKLVRDLCQREATEVLDPVFLQDGTFWRKLARPYPNNYENYVFYYRLMGRKDSDAAARSIATQLGKKLVVMTDGLVRFSADHVLRDVGPQEFLRLMEGADFVVTDSFHGVAFSIIFEKQFFFNDFGVGTQERGMQLLDKLGLSQACCGNAAAISGKADYQSAALKLSQAILDSKVYLDSVIRGVKSVC